MVVTNGTEPALGRGQRETLTALVRTVLPHLSAPSPPADLVAMVEDRLTSAPASVRYDLLRALDVLGHPVAGLVVSRQAGRFARLDDAQRASAFQKWATSTIPVARSVHQALRKFVLSTWYATPEGKRDAGVREPLHVRGPAVSWEGSLPGVPDDAEPVARGTDPLPSPSPRAVPGGVSRSDQLRGETRLTADVVVIGSGAGGAVAAARLAEAGREVVIVEGGEYLHAPDFTEDEGALAPRLFADQSLRATVDGSLTLLQGGAVGGGTTVNWMLMLRPLERVLDSWARAGIAGFTMRDLAPHLERIEREVHATMVPDDGHAPSNRALLAGARQLGWRASAARINAKDCVQAGTCSLGCRYDAKRSALLTYLPRAFAAGARLLADCAVDRIDVTERAVPNGSPRKRVTATVRDPRTRTVVGTVAIDAPVVVLAAGAVGTPVILEKSGLGGGGVGRYLWLHPTTAVMATYPDETYPLAGIPQSALCDEFIARDRHGYGFWIECPALQPALAAAALPGFGPAHRAAMQQLDHLVAFIVLVRDGSGSDRSMGSVWVDGRGYTRIRYRMTAADRINAQLGVEAAARMHLAAGATQAASLDTEPIIVRREADLAALRHTSTAPNRATWFSAHVNGTCRLGTHPATSGVTPDGERHGVRGLYVLDGSILPTSLGVNPQETIMAMSSLLAERLAAGS